jgi:plasmid maintenance system antidote protein VapI
MRPGTPISDVLRRAILDSGLPLLRIERETGVQRASISRFVRGERSLRLDMADKLAAYFGLELTPVKAKPKKE